MLPTYVLALAIPGTQGGTVRSGCVPDRQGLPNEIWDVLSCRWIILG